MIKAVLDPCPRCGYPHNVNPDPAPDVGWLLAVLEADAVDTSRDPMWRYGVKHSLTLIRRVFTPTEENKDA
jgi:hypothetical protein